MTHLHGGHATSLDMTEGAIWPILLQFTIPLLMGTCSSSSTTRWTAWWSATLSAAPRWRR